MLWEIEDLPTKRQHEQRQNRKENQVRSEPLRGAWSDCRQQTQGKCGKVGQHTDDAVTPWRGIQPDEPVNHDISPPWRVRNAAAAKLKLVTGFECIPVKHANRVERQFRRVLGPELEGFLKKIMSDSDDMSPTGVRMANIQDFAAAGP